jgi:hypothetical protein
MMSAPQWRILVTDGGMDAQYGRRGAITLSISGLVSTQHTDLGGGVVRKGGRVWQSIDIKEVGGRCE